MTTDLTHILLVEDDMSLGFLLSEFLTSEGYQVKLCRDGLSAYNNFMRNAYHLCLLDVMLPKMDGFELAEKIREQNKQVPIMFLTAKSIKEDKLRGYQIGADDYITKPFDEDLLLWKIKAVLKRKNIAEGAEEVDEYQIGLFSYKPNKHELYFEDEKIRITDKENQILRLLCMNKGSVLKRKDALQAVYGSNDYFTGRSFDVFIAKLRKILKKDPNICIENVFGVGFMLKDGTEVA